MTFSFELFFDIFTDCEVITSSLFCSKNYYESWI